MFLLLNKAAGNAAQTALARMKDPLTANGEQRASETGVPVASLGKRDLL